MSRFYCETCRKLPSATQVLPGGVVDIFITSCSDTKKKLDNPQYYLMIYVLLLLIFIHYYDVLNIYAADLNVLS